MNMQMGGGQGVFGVVIVMNCNIETVPEGIAWMGLQFRAVEVRGTVALMRSDRVGFGMWRGAQAPAVSAVYSPYQSG